MRRAVSIVYRTATKPKISTDFTNGIPEGNNTIYSGKKNPQNYNLKELNYIITKELN